MNMKHLLASGLTVRQEKIDAFGSQSRPSDGGGEALRHPEHRSAGAFVEIRQMRRVLDWDNQEMTCIDRPDVHEGDADIVTLDDAARGTTSDHFTEYAFVHQSVR